jgi:hypothetical protein
MRSTTGYNVRLNKKHLNRKGAESAKEKQCVIGICLVMAGEWQMDFMPLFSLRLRVFAVMYCGF